MFDTTKVVLTVNGKAMTYSAAVKEAQKTVSELSKIETSTMVNLLPLFDAAMRVSKACFTALYNESGYTAGYRNIVIACLTRPEIRKIAERRGPSAAQIAKDTKDLTPADVEKILASHTEKDARSKKEKEVFDFSLSAMKEEKQARDKAGKENAQQARSLQDILADIAKAKALLEKLQKEYDAATK